MLYNDSKNKYDFNKLNEQVTTLLAKEGYNIDPRKNIQCINAGNHNHGDKNHSCTIYSDGLYCHGCNKLYGFTDIVAKKYGYNINNNDYLKEKNFYSYLDKEVNALNIDSVSVARTSSHDIDMTKLENSNAKEAKKIPQKYIERYKAFTRMKLDNFSYFIERGISIDTCKEINACIASLAQIKDIFLNDSDILPTLNINYKMFAIIPVKSLDSEIVGMTFRNIDKEDYFKHLLLKGISKEPFYTPNILKETQNEVIFVVEGIYDSLALYELGFKAIAMCGNSSVKNKELPKNNCYVVIPDNDISGENKAINLQRELHELDCIYLDYAIAKEVYNNSIFKKCKDANEMLLKDSELLKEKITELYALGYNLVASLATEQIKIHTEERNGANKEVKSQMSEIISADNKSVLNGKYESENETNKTSEYIKRYIEIVKSLKYEKVPTGIDKIDTMLEGGFNNGDLVLLGGKPGAGKTALMLQIAYNLAQEGEKVSIYSCEMNFMRLFQRLQALHAKINNIDLENMNAILVDMENKNALKNISIYTISEIETIDDFFEMLSENPQHAFVDYLQIAPTREKGTDTEKIKHINKLSRDYTNATQKICIIATALSRGTTLLNPKNKREMSQVPTLSSARDTSDIEYTSDIFIALYHEYNQIESDPLDYQSYNEAMQEKIRKVKITVLKNRNGQSGSIEELKHHAKENFFK